MKTIRQYLTRFLPTLTLLGIAVALAAPAAQAAPAPYLEVTALHQSIYADGYNFFTNGQAVLLEAYGLVNGQRVFLGSAERTTSAQFDYTIAWDFGQAQDPCLVAATPQVEVDAYLAQPVAVLHAAVARRVNRHFPWPIVLHGPEIATATVAVQCGVIIY